MPEIGVAMTAPIQEHIFSSGEFMIKMNVGGLSVRMEFSMPHSAQYRDAVALAREIYAKAYCADIHPAPDCFLGCYEFSSDELLGCAGLSFASKGPLFSEQYIDDDIAAALQGVFDHDVPRDKVVEVSSLATAIPQLGAEMLRSIPIACWCFGMKAILCTATGHLQTLFDRVRLPFSVVAHPDPARLAASSQGHWGSYYETDPKTGIIRLDRIGHLFQSHCGKYDLYEGPHAHRQDALTPA